ncbi:type II secretion system F family protein [Pseudoxanthomonas koreensis]|uniref:type II secretion system F family protein n=1 Tax=Pseudoxanthomonas koreensis TaxID=266061 RepID=UPI0035A66925
MPVFDYRAIDAGGQMRHGRMQAGSRAELVTRLQEQGQLPVDARLAVEGAERSSRWRLRLPVRASERGLAGDTLVQFTVQLSTLLGAGQPLDRALSVLMELPGDAQARGVIAQLGEAVRGGLPLSAAMAAQGGTFSRLYVNMVRAGEAGGSLPQTLAQLAAHLERSSELRAQVVNAMVYPLILVTVVGLALLFLLAVVLPQFSAMYDSLDVELPWFSRAVLATGLAVQAHGWILLCLLVVAGLALWRLWRQPAMRHALDGWLLRQPLSGPLVARVDTARLARTLGTLLGNGVPLLEALDIARNVLGNRVLARDLDLVCEAVRGGRSLAVAVADGGHLPVLAVHMIRIGEESGELAAMLLRVADTFEREAARAVQRMLAAMVPMVTLALALVVGLVIVAVLVPLYDMAGAIG